MKNWIEQIINFFRLVFRSRMPNKPVANKKWDAKDQVGLILGKEYKVGGLNTYEDGSTELVVSDTPLRQTPGDLALADRIVNYMHEKGYHVIMNPELGNIVYISGLRDVFGLAKENKVDEWDDLRLIVRMTESGTPYIDFWQAASTEPGNISRKSAAAKKLGGVATVVPGQYKAWKLGFHKHDHDHPALVQCANVAIWRDANENATFENEMMFEGVFGLNQHSTRPGFEGPRVGAWSAGCLVAKDFAQHLQFIEKVKAWDMGIYMTTIIPGKALFNDDPNNA